MAILRKLYLRPSEVEISESGAAGVDSWLIVCDSVHTREEIFDWFYSDPAVPIAGKSVAVFRGRLAMCNKVKFAMHTKSRRHWIATATYAPPDQGGGGGSGGGSSVQQPITQPNPVGIDPSAPGAQPDPEDPDTWDPVVLRRSIRQSKPQAEAFYEGGYSGKAHTWCNVGSPDARRQIVNSAIVPMTGIPDASEVGSLWLFRFVRKTPADFSGILAFEDTVNQSSFTFAHEGLSVTFQTKSAWCTSVEFNQTRINNQKAWEVEITIQQLFGNERYVLQLADRGFDGRAWPGDTDESSQAVQVSDSRVRKFVDKRGRSPTEPVFMNGDGKANAAEANPVFGKWRYQKAMDWASFPLLSTLVP